MIVSIVAVVEEIVELEEVIEVVEENIQNLQFLDECEIVNSYWFWFQHIYWTTVNSLLINGCLRWHETFYAQQAFSGAGYTECLERVTELALFRLNLK